ncbi:MAG: V-type ATP synthase subunit E [Ruminococcus sp.]|nr:V-type ATP synthase subunit E [Ruminococcus sp.]
MNQSQKTSSFLRAINKYAKEQSDAILLEVEEFKKQEIEKATKEGIEDAYTLIQKEIAVKKAQIISDVAKREQESRKALFIKRNGIVEKVFADAKAKLLEFVSSEDYVHYLKKSANEVAELFENNECIIYVKENDIDKAELIKGIIPNGKVCADNSIELGGIKAHCEALSIVADDTLDTKLSDQRVWFAENSGLKVV